MSSPEEAKKLVDKAIKDLGLQTPLTDKQLSEELDALIAEQEEQGDMSRSYARLMPIARRHFIYRADLSKVASMLNKKLKHYEWLGTGTSSLFF